MLPQREWFLRRFGVKTGLDFAHFGQELGMVFKETTLQFKMITKNKKHANLSNDAIIPLRPGLKTDVKNDIFWCEIGSGFGEPGGTPPTRIPPPPPPPPPPPLPVYRLPLAVNGLDLITQPFYSYSPCNEETICHANCLMCG